MGDSTSVWRNTVDNPPANWKRYLLGELFSNREESGHQGLPLLSVTADRGVVRRDDVGRRDTSNADKTKYLRICPGDIVYNTMRMWQGVSALSDREGIVSPAYTVCVPSGRILPEYAKYLLKLPALVRHFRAHSQGMVDDTLSLKYALFAKIPVVLPPTDEQARIVTILSSIDASIAATTAVIDQARQVKDALLQELLARGIGHARFKQTEIGEVPVGWEVRRLGSICASITVGLATSVTQHYRHFGVPLIRNQNIKSGYFDGRDMLYLDPAFCQQNEQKVVRFNEVITVRTGANVGVTCLVPQALDGSQTFTTLITRPSASKLSARYLCQHMNSPLGHSEIRRLQVGGGKNNLNVGHLTNYFIAIPPIQEQERISDAIDGLTLTIVAQNMTLVNHQTLRQALRTFLLTGSP